MKYLVAILAIVIGVIGVVAGEADDSPRLQLLGVLLIIGAIVLGMRMVPTQQVARPRAKVEHSPAIVGVSLSGLETMTSALSARPGRILEPRSTPG